MLFLSALSNLGEICLVSTNRTKFLLFFFFFLCMAIFICSILTNCQLLENLSEVTTVKEHFKTVSISV